MDELPEEIANFVAVRTLSAELEGWLGIDQAGTARLHLLAASPDIAQEAVEVCRMDLLAATMGQGPLVRLASDTDWGAADTSGTWTAKLDYLQAALDARAG